MTHEEVIIRELALSDIPVASKLLHQMWIDHSKSTELLDKDYIKNYDVSTYCEKSINDPDQQIFIAEVDKKVVGVARVEIEKSPGMYGVDKIMYFDDLVVDPEHRRRGIADKLINRRIEYAKQNKITICYSKIYGFNQPAQKLMKKHGFEDKYHYFYKFLE